MFAFKDILMLFHVWFANQDTRMTHKRRYDWMIEWRHHTEWTHHTKIMQASVVFWRLHHRFFGLFLSIRNNARSRTETQQSSDTMSTKSVQAQCSSGMFCHAHGRRGRKWGQEEKVRPLYNKIYVYFWSIKAFRFQLGMFVCVQEKHETMRFSPSSQSNSEMVKRRLQTPNLSDIKSNNYCCCLFMHFKPKKCMHICSLS